MRRHKMQAHSVQRVTFSGTTEEMRSEKMAMKNVAVYDNSSTYMKRFLKYVNHRKASGVSIKGFSDLSALKDYLEKSQVDVLLFSMEEQVAKGEEAEQVCAAFMEHPSVREFVYFGERRNSKSRVKHIDKYQPAGKILAELMDLLLPEREETVPQDETEPNRVELISVFSPAPEEEAAQCAVEIAELLSIRKEVLLLDLERFSLLAASEEGRPAGGISDLIYVYRTNPNKLTECLRESRSRIRNLDVLTSPENMEDLDEIAEKDWPAFLKQISLCGGYEAIVVHMAEAFRNPEYLFDASKQIYLPTSKSEAAMRKMQRLATDFTGRGRKDLYDKMQAVLTPSARKANEETGEEWNW